MNINEKESLVLQLERWFANAGFPKRRITIVKGMVGVSCISVEFRKPLTPKQMIGLPPDVAGVPIIYKNAFALFESRNEQITLDDSPSTPTERQYNFYEPN